jgi:ferric-dicitrate binding protein FerR (iron transport regulator)
MNRKKFHQILKRYVQGSATDTEKALIDQWYQLLDDENLLEMEEPEIEVIENRLWNEIYAKTQGVPLEESIPVHGKIRRIVWLQRVAIAALLIGFMAIGFIYWMNRSGDESAVYVKQLKRGMKEQVNHTHKPLQVNFEEGSIAILQPNARISYPPHFLASRREVYIDGEAFFNVSKNPVRPFYVYHHHIVTHVLGTSFTVKACSDKKEVEVSVRTGRVEVYENKEILQNVAARKSNGVVLTPNQKVVYHEESREFEETLVEVPLPVVIDEKSKVIQPISFVFDETPLSVVLQSLEKVYGIEIVVENDAIYNCPFTGDLSQQNLYTKLDMINQVLKTNYEVKGTKILIKGKGCY